MSYENKNIRFLGNTCERESHVFEEKHVKVISDSQFLRTLVMNVAIKKAQSISARNSSKDWVWSKMRGKHRQM